MWVSTLVSMYQSCDGLLTCPGCCLLGLAPAPHDPPKISGSGIGWTGGHYCHSPFQHSGCATQLSEGLLPGITACNVIGPHICWGSWGAEAATVHRPDHTWAGPLVELVTGSHDAQCLIVLKIKFLQQAEREETCLWVDGQAAKRLNQRTLGGR